MLLAINMLLACIQLVQMGYAQDKAKPSSVCGYELVKSIAQKIELLEITNQNLLLKLQSISMFNYEQLAEIKTAVYALDGHCPCNTTGSFVDLATSSAARGFNRFPAQSLTLDESSKVSGFSTNLPSFCQKGRNGIQLIQILNSELSPFYVNCIQDQQQGDEPWILIQRRRDGSVDFHREWFDYKQGFGNLDSEFFMGLDKLHALTQSELYELWIQLKDFSNEKRWARYSSFAIGDESQAYVLNMLGGYTGNAGDSLFYHEGHTFSTKDRDNDECPLNCAMNFTGAWWYNRCHHSNLNGKYLRGESYQRETIGMGIIWSSWHGYTYSLKYAHMAIRPVRLS